MIDEGLEAELRAGIGTGDERGLLAVYADWLEARGRADMAKALRERRAIEVPPVSLALTEPNEHATPSWIHSRADFPKPFEMLVVDDWVGNPDPRPIIDRREREVSLPALDQRMAEMKIDLRFDLSAAGLESTTVVIPIRRLLDCELPSVRLRLVSAGVTGEKIEEGLRHVFADERFRTVERAWRSLAWLSSRVSPPVSLSIVRASAEELIFDYDDSPTLGHSGIWYMPPNRNHLGMAPETAVVLGSPVPLDERGPRLLRGFGEVAHMKSLPFIASTNLDVATAHPFLDAVPSLGRHVTVAAPSFVLREAHPFEEEPLSGHASYLLAARMAESYRLHGGGGGATGVLRDVRLARSGGLAQAIWAASRGIAMFVQRGSDVELFDGVTASPASDGDSRALDLHVLVCRIGALLQNLHFRCVWMEGLSEEEQADAGLVARRLEECLRRRLSCPALRFSLVEPRFVATPDGFDATLKAVLSIELSSATSGEVLRHSERLTLRFGAG